MVNNQIPGNELLTSKITYATAPIDAAFDMGGQKWAGGRVYDSLSGHSFLIGQKTGKVISFGVVKKSQQTNKTQ